MAFRLRYTPFGLLRGGCLGGQPAKPANHPAGIRVAQLGCVGQRGRKKCHFEGYITSCPYACLMMYVGRCASDVGIYAPGALR